MKLTLYVALLWRCGIHRLFPGSSSYSGYRITLVSAFALDASTNRRALH
jgi:hypothetical protein